MKDTNITMYLKNCPLPGLSVGNIDLGSGTDHYVLQTNGTRIEFEDLVMEFFISEDWSNYIEIYEMIMSYLGSYLPEANDITLQMFDNTNEIIKSFIIEDCYPISLSTVETTVIGEESYLTCTVAFSCNRWLPN